MRRGELNERGGRVDRGLGGRIEMSDATYHDIIDFLMNAYFDRPGSNHDDFDVRMGGLRFLSVRQNPSNARYVNSLMDISNRLNVPLLRTAIVPYLSAEQLADLRRAEIPDDSMGVGVAADPFNNAIDDNKVEVAAGNMNAVVMVPTVIPAVIPPMIAEDNGDGGGAVIALAPAASGDQQGSVSVRAVDNPAHPVNQPMDRYVARNQRIHFYNNARAPGQARDAIRGRVVNMFIGDRDVARRIDPWVAVNGHYPIGPELAIILHDTISRSVEAQVAARARRNPGMWNDNAFVRIGIQSADNAMFTSTGMMRLGQWRREGLERLNFLVDHARRSGRNLVVGNIAVVLVGALPGGGGKRLKKSDVKRNEFLLMDETCDNDNDNDMTQSKIDNDLFCSTLGKHTIIKSHVIENDLMCAQRSLLLLCAYKDRHVNKAAYRKLRRERSHRQGTPSQIEFHAAALQLTYEAGLSPNHPIDLSHLISLAKVLSRRRSKECHILVVDGSQSMAPIFRTMEERDPDKIKDVEWFVLLLRNEHYDAVSKIHNLMFGQRYFCFSCHKSTQYKEHFCKFSKACKACGMKDINHMEDKQVNDEWVTCDDCFRKFPSVSCFEHHLEKGMCASSWKCQTCKKSFQRECEGKQKSKTRLNPENHFCGQMWCSNCNDYCNKEHQCYMGRKKKLSVYENYVFADFETDQSTGEHIVNLAVSIEFDGTLWPVFSSIEEWVGHMLLPEHDGKTFIFHNGRGFDFHPILNRLIKIGKAPSCIMSGRKIMYMELAKKKRFSLKTGRRFVDSLNFLTMPLTSFTRTFNLKTKKGYYCHFFNTQENLFYVGCIPSKEQFGYSDFTVEKRSEFDAWYEERSKRQWDNKFELLDYCTHDVKLLREGCMEFRKIVVEQCEDDPFLQKTLSSSAMNIFRTTFLEEKTIAALSHKIATELRPAFKGGRVEAFKMFYKCRKDEKIAYVDFTSLYPFCNSRCSYPIGHPEFHDCPSNETWTELLNTGLGVFEVDVTCPQNLYIPLLHSQHSNSILMFDLLPKTKIKYTNLELLKAQELGYVITKVYSVYHWKETKIGLFSEYMKKFLKLKQEAAGWPSESMCEDEKKTYLKEYFEKEGIELDRNQIQKNDGMYKTAKFYLNALWGKFAQRNADSFTTTSIIHSTDEGIREFNNILAKDLLSDCYIVNENTCLVKSKNVVDDVNKRLPNVNISVGIFTTAHARLKLYNEFLEKSGQRILYCDTDSCIFVYNCKQEKPDDIIKLGNFLGDPTSEIGCKDSYDTKTWISEFVSGGPKHYGYITNEINNIKKAVKVKGIRLNSFKVQHELTYERMKSIVQSVHNNAMIFYTKEFKIDDEHRIINITTKKTYQVNFTKRQVTLNNDYLIDTKPWKNEHEFTTFIEVQNVRKRNRSNFETKSAITLYLNLKCEVVEESDENYLVAITGFESENIRSWYKTLLNIDSYDHISLELIVADFVNNVDTNHNIHYKCESNYLDNFEKCATIKHIY